MDQANEKIDWQINEANYQSSHAIEVATIIHDLFFIGCQTFADPGKHRFRFANLARSTTNHNRLFVLRDLVAAVGALH